MLNYVWITPVPSLLTVASYTTPRKITNFYRLDAHEYKQLMNTAVTKSYRKASTDAAATIISAEKQIAKNLNLDNRIDALAAKSAFITLKDHKPNFANNPTCRLINPSKSEIGIVSKKILQRVNAKIVSTTLTLIRSSRGSIKYQTSHHIHL